MRIGELSRRTGVDARLLRYYEKRGLLRPARLPNGYREFSPSDIEVVAQIRSLLAAGLSTTTIASLPCGDDGEASPPACAAAIARFRDERGRVERAITTLETNRATLDGVIEVAHQRLLAQ